VRPLAPPYIHTAALVSPMVTNREYTQGTIFSDVTILTTLIILSFSSRNIRGHIYYYKFVSSYKIRKVVYGGMKSATVSSRLRSVRFLRGNLQSTEKCMGVLSDNVCGVTQSTKLLDV
jgi:hypothetical protein